MSRVRLRPTMLSDLDWVVTVEHDAANLPFITPWERTQHEGAIRFPDSRHFIIEAGDAWPRAGFVILQGCRTPQRSVELKRIVLPPAAHGQGLGRAFRESPLRFREKGRTHAPSAGALTRQRRFCEASLSTFGEDAAQEQASRVV